MRLILMAALASAALIGGCKGQGSGNAANGSAANSSGGAATGATGDRAELIAHCEQRVRGNPQVPASFDVSGACGCAVDQVSANRSDAKAYMLSQEGAQAFGQALTTCMTQRMIAADAPGEADEGASPPAPEADAADAEGEEK